jgi:glycosyltransferase involved in cell wall biosynthesis
VEERAAHDKRITYLGYTTPDELVKCMAAVDAVVVPSLCYENSPTVIYESLSSGIPLIASRIGGVGELIQEGKTGFLFTPGDEADLVRAIREMNKQKEMCAARAHEIQESIVPYALDKYAERLLAVLTEAMAKPRSVGK